MKNQAQRYLSRLVAVTGSSSFPQALSDGTVKLEKREQDDKARALIGGAAKKDERLNEEALSLARERGWSLLRVGLAHDRWPRLDNATLADALPRIARVLTREAWEAETSARGCDDEDVASLLFAFAAERCALVAEIEAIEPLAAQLGA